MNITEIFILIKNIFSIIATASLALYFFLPVFSVIGFFATKKFPEAKKYHKYAIMIAARNEEKVIGNLIESVNAQDYPKDLVTVFVVADNCTDSTAEVARSHGAVCYERFDTEHRTKGYALEFLVENIKRDYGIDAFEAYFIFDADNLLREDYISRMNEAFDSGEKIVTSFRNTKNFDDNWIAAGYGIHWIRTIRYEHRGRSALGLATRVQGTGFMFANEVIKNGWHYVSFTEDRAFAADAVREGYRISYCDRAEFYDEQPTSLRIALRQRLRWAKGHLQAFAELGPKLLKNAFFSSSAQKCKPNINTADVCDSTCDDLYKDAKNLMQNLQTKSKTAFAILFLPVALIYGLSYIVLLIKNGINRFCNRIRASGLYRKIIYSKFFRSFKQRFMSYDMFTITYPNNFISVFVLLVCFLIDILLSLISDTPPQPLCAVLLAFLASLCVRWIGSMLLGIYVFFVERSRIKKIGFFKKLFYIFMWPIFDIIGALSVLFALFMHIEWKPIPHTSTVSIKQISQSDNKR